MKHKDLVARSFDELRGRAGDAFLNPETDPALHEVILRLYDLRALVSIASGYLRSSDVDISDKARHRSLVDRISNDTRHLHQLLGLPECPPNSYPTSLA